MSYVASLFVDLNVVALLLALFEIELELTHVAHVSGWTAQRPQ
jgi:preprotein translocase subunit SecF